jgi:arylsulfatase A-like enzyme
MSYHQIFFIAIVGAVSLCLTIQLSAESGPRPNLLIILSDDQGWGDAGFRGASDVKTPNLDRLAASGVEFRQGYVTAPQCIPSRAGLLTGRYQQHAGIECNPDDNKNDVYQLPARTATLASLLKAAGYRTGMVGKWHLGEPLSSQPFNKGFEWCAYMRHGMGYHFLKSAWPKDKDGRGTNWFRDEKDRTIPIEGRGYLTEVFTDKALEFIRKDDERPFFLYLAYHPPHWPLEAPDESVAEYRDIKDVNRRVCAAMITDMDAQIGRLMDGLKSRGLDQNTMIVFLSDNGAPQYSGPAITPVKMGENASLNGPLNGCKGLLLEGGIRVPFVMSWPGKLSAGTKVDWPVSALDLTPTFLAAAGAPPMAGADGMNLLSYLKPGISATGPDRALFWRFDTQWDRQNAVRRGPWKLVRSGPKPARQLFNIREDPSETNDLSAKNPEKAAALAGELDAWMETLPPPNPEWFTKKKLPDTK